MIEIQAGTMGFEQLAALKAHLNQNTEGTMSACSPTSSGIDTKGKIKQRSKPPRPSADAAARAVATLQKCFPRAFPRSPTPKVPLKIGILKDVLTHAASIGLSERDIRNGMKLWCRGHHYWTRLTAGNARVDLQGMVVGVVSAEDAEYGAGQEQMRLKRRRERLAKSGDPPKP
jgi:ProP effector